MHPHPNDKECKKSFDAVSTIAAVNLVSCAPPTLLILFPLVQGRFMENGGLLRKFHFRHTTDEEQNDVDDREWKEDEDAKEKEERERD